MASLRNDEQLSTPEKRKGRSAARGLLLLAVAVVAVGGAGVLLTRYMDARVAAARVPTVRILVAAQPIRAATPIKAEAVAVVDWPAAARPRDGMSDASNVVGRIPLTAISPGEVILPSKLADSAARSGLATLVPTGMRAVAVKVDDVVGVAGFIKPGDSVDVIVTMRPDEQRQFMSKIVLQNVQVLAVGKEIENRGAEKEKQVPITVATLLVSGEESERLALAAARGQLLLTLRSFSDDESIVTRGVAPPALLGPQEQQLAQSGPAVPQRKKVAVVPVPIAEAKRKQVVEILRGDLFEKRDFAAGEKSR